MIQDFATLRLCSEIRTSLKEADSTEGFKSPGSWNRMVTHRVSIRDIKEIDAELLDWLKQAYEKT
jgi:hypothetical protein